MKKLRLRRWVKVVGIILFITVFECICWTAIWNTKAEIDKCIEEGNTRYICEERMK